MKVMTPFAVEFAHADLHRAGAPTLAPVPTGGSRPICGRLLLLRLRYEPQDAQDLLFQSVEDSTSLYQSYEAAVHNHATTVDIALLEDFADVKEVFYIRNAVSLDLVMNPNASDSEKGHLLGEQAVASLTAETYARGTDGIQYLIDATAAGIETRLTPFYRDAILHMAGEATDLAAARVCLARQKVLA